ncbi:transporter [Pseudomonas sp. HR96]|uniref:transporter n=1 Tax=Pseudomonas sp. HR96 TaxID=1027966 RepID=UPI002A751613|nr:transporter [Pseudomonas sp. HR96]WPO98508.1 transporter [Pseudomonas sp. HR96]
MSNAIIKGQQDADMFGLVCGFHFSEGHSAREVDSAALLQVLSERELARGKEFLWLHLNLAHAGCERWMRSHLELPDEFYEALHEGSRSTRIEHVDDALLAVVNDVVFSFGMASSDVSTLWLCATERVLVSARLQPLHSVDKLRLSVRRGEEFDTPMALLVHLFRDQAEVLEQIVRKTTMSVDGIEDQLLSLRLSDNRADLGSMRRVLVRLQRLLALEPGSLLRLLNRPPRWLRDDDLQALRQATEEFALVINDITALGERIKLLQEEIAATLNEQSSRTLFTLTVVTVLALPINIIAGFFGMNVGGVPLSSDPNGFWILVALVATFTLLVGRWAFKKRSDY